MPREEFQDAQQVCLTGHQINSSYHSYPASNRRYCEECGAGTVYQCPSCKSPIKGRNHIRGIVFADKIAVPDFCDACGEQFPWSKLRPAVGVLPRESALALILRLCQKMHTIVRQLRNRHGDRPTLDVGDEYDLQDLMHALLRLDFEDVRAEECTPSYAGGSSRVDFLIPAHEIVLELKMTRPGLKRKEIGEQLIIDIARYTAHPKCKTLVCFVYDPAGHVSNPQGLMTDLTKDHGGLPVHVLILPC